MLLVCCAVLEYEFPEVVYMLDVAGIIRSFIVFFPAVKEQ